ncbi:MAG: hypothetical protein H0V44_16210 [Planctomycetes bacterium]|nr:hypothetical protein [Planctomycetota bacterium]
MDARVNGERLDAWVALFDWTREGVLRFRGEDAGAQLGSGDTVRLRLLLHALESSTPVRERFQAAVATLVADTDAASLLAEAGMPSDRGFLHEATSRLWANLLPEPRDTHDLRQFVRRCYRNSTQVARFTRWPAELFHRLVEVVMPPATSPAWTTLRRSVVDAVHLLCVRVESQGLSPKLRSRSRSGALPVVESPYFRLARTADGLLAVWTGGPIANAGAGDAASALHDWQDALSACRAEHLELGRSIRSEGVSVDIVFSLDVIDRCLFRLESLGMILTCPPGLERSALVQRLLTRLVSLLHEARSLRALASGNLRQLHSRIVERSGRTGEHFIATDRGEYGHLLLAAAGGGVLMVWTTAAKLMASEFEASDFVHGLVYGLIYAVSFLFLHHLHLVLATKAPAMTAATIATDLRDERGSGKLDEIVDRMARVGHSQIAAAAGNVVMVALGALAFTTLWELTVGRSFLDPATAQKTYASFSPLTSGTVFFAAFTGVILWLSSVAGGWLDNWSALRRIPQGIADHPLGLRLGRDRMERWSQSWQRHVGPWGANISLGLMLGMIPAIGHFFGVPLDMRHVTLSTGMLFTACGSLHDGWYSSGWFLLAVSGIVTMFVLNLGVSFTLSLWTATRALGVPAADVHELLRRLGRRMLRRPWDFILPFRPAEVHPVAAEVVPTALPNISDSVAQESNRYVSSASK